MTFHDFEARIIRTRAVQRSRKYENKSKPASIEAKITQF